MITEWKGTAGCQNQNPAGENVPPKGIGGWLYVASTVLGDDRDINTRAAQRKASKIHCEKIAQSARVLLLCDEYPVPDLLDGRR